MKRNEIIPGQGSDFLYRDMRGTPRASTGRYRRKHLDRQIDCQINRQRDRLLDKQIGIQMEKDRQSQHWKIEKHTPRQIAIEKRLHCIDI